MFSAILQVATTSDLMLAYVDFFLGGDEKRDDLPPPLHQRFPLSLVFGGDGSYMTPFTLYSDNILTSLISQVCYQHHCNSCVFNDRVLYEICRSVNISLYCSRYHPLYGID